MNDNELSQSFQRAECIMEVTVMPLVIRALGMLGENENKGNQMNMIAEENA